MQKELREKVKLALPEEDCYLEYYTVKHSILNLPSQLNLSTYGVEVVKRSCDNQEIIESKLISDVCCSMVRMNDMVSILASNTVTPVSLRDVLEILLEDERDLLAPAY